MLVNVHIRSTFQDTYTLNTKKDPKLLENYEHNQIIRGSNMANACVPKKSPDICLGEISFGMELALAFYS